MIDYRSAPGLSASAIKQGRKSLLHMNSYLTGHGKKSTASMQFGTWFHMAVLEPIRFRDESTVYWGAKRGKVWAQVKDKYGVENILTPAERDDLLQMRRAVQNDMAAGPILDSMCCTELALFWDEPECGPCKCRIDGISSVGGLVELKTTAYIGAPFLSNAYKLGYHLAAGWYARGAKANGLNPWPFTLIAVESKHPWAVSVYQPNERMLDDWGKEALEIARKYKAYEGASHYPGPTQGIQDWTLPGWARIEQEPVELKIGGEAVEV